MTPIGDSRVNKGLSIAAVFLALLAILLVKGAVRPGSGSTGGSATGSPAAPEAATSSITSVRNDATADYAAAEESGKPVYLLFHSLTCQPCVEMSAVADKVVPAYRDKVVFVNALTDDPSAQRLASRFSFQYIPTSFFIDRKGKVVDSHTGVLTAEQMKAQLDGLIAR